MDFNQPDHSGRPIRFFDVVITLVLGGVIWAQVEIYRSLKPAAPEAPVAAAGPLAAVPAQAVSASASRVFVGKRLPVRHVAHHRSHASAMVISSRPRLASHRAKKHVARKARMRGFSPGRYEVPRDEFVAPLPVEDEDGTEG